MNVRTEQCQPSGVAIIVAMTRERVIGAAGTLPWDLPDDRRLFKRLTIDQAVIMGRRTFESLGRPLPNRHNIVLSRTLAATAEIEVCRDFQAALNAARRSGRKIFVIGGTELYRQALPIANELHVTWVTQTVSGETFFPPVDLSLWAACETIDLPGGTYVRYLRRDPA